MIDNRGADSCSILGFVIIIVAILVIFFGMSKPSTAIMHAYTNRL